MTVGCFSPEEGLESETDTGESPTSETTGEPGMTSGDPTTDPGETGGPTTDNSTTVGTTTSDSTGGTETSDPTGNATSNPTETTGATETGATDPTGEDPFCGDGNVDPGEECDDGLDNNGLDQSCLPDCNLNVCGDGNLAPDEACDDGEDDNVLEVGACAPDCSRIIEEKVISRSSTFIGGNLAPNPVTFADSRCPVGSRALFAVPGMRQATNGTPNTADAMMDWPLQPYTAYVRGNGVLVWMTEEEPLLGVRAGENVPLEEPVVPACTNPPCIISGPAISGLNSDWTNAMSDTCNGWASSSETVEVQLGNVTSSTGYLHSSEGTCELDGNGVSFMRPVFYCVEQ